MNEIFGVAVTHKELFPKQLVTNQSLDEYFEKWVGRYVDAMQNPPSSKSLKPKTSCTDPMIRKIVQSALLLTDEEAYKGEKYHDRFMSAENIQGNLLEEYIAKNIEPYGFFWCCGEVLHAIDFCTANSFFLQIKNKSNSENSSSSKIRTGTSIEKWYRLGTSVKNKVKYPDYKWTDLNVIIASHATKNIENPPSLSEGGYLSFIKEAISKNKWLLKIKTE